MLAELEKLLMHEEVPVSYKFVLEDWIVFSSHNYDLIKNISSGQGIESNYKWTPVPAGRYNRTGK